jgi:hypothetical protein
MGLHAFLLAQAIGIGRYNPAMSRKRPGFANISRRILKACGLSRTASVRTIPAFNPLCRQPIHHFSIMK